MRAQAANGRARRMVLLGRGVTYVDPADADWPTVHLVDGLIAKPTTQTKTQIEDQTTVVLAWLLDNAPSFARAFATRCLAEPPADLRALASAATLRARTWLTLPKLPCSPGGGQMRPGLSLVGDGRSFEVIVENKVGAAPHHYECANGCHPPLIPQQEAYALSWERCPPEEEALVRRVCVLSRDPIQRDDLARLRGSDLLWSDVRAMLGEQLENGSIDGCLRVIAADFCAVLDERVIPQPKPTGTVKGIGKRPIDPARHPVLAWGAELLSELLPVVAERTDGKFSGPILNGNSFYAGGYARVPGSSAPELSLWVWVTEAGRPYSVEGFPDGLWIGRDGLWPSGPLEVLVDAGFQRMTDLAGFSSHRRFFGVDELQDIDSASSVVAVLADELVPTIQRAARA